MERREQQTENGITLDRDAQINVVVNNPYDEDDEIDLGRVFHTMKKTSRVYIWVILLCMTLGICVPLLLYQFTKEPLTVSSVVTLNYEVPVPDDPELEIDTEEEFMPVEDLTAPDGEPLDVNRVTSSYVLQNAVADLSLSQPVTLENLRANLKIERILTEDSRRQQEVAASMVEDNNNSAYQQVQEISLTYSNKFVVSLTNGFGEPDSRKKLYLKDEELRLVLDRILASYNDYLVTTYADLQLPDDEISVIDVENLDIMESLELLRTAVDNLYDFCDEKSENIKAWRSWENGRSLTDLMDLLRQAKEVNVEYLYSYVYTNSIVLDAKTMLTTYQYELRETQTKLDTVNESIATTKKILESYKNDEIFVSMQESDGSRATKTTTDYYNNLVLQQSDNYKAATELEIEIADLEDKIARLQEGSSIVEDEEVQAEMERTLAVCASVYQDIRNHFERILESPFYTTYAEHSAAQGKSLNFLVASAKKIAIGLALGLILGLGLWFLSGLAPEFRQEEETTPRRKEGAQS